MCMRSDPDSEAHSWVAILFEWLGVWMGRWTSNGWTDDVWTNRQVTGCVAAKDLPQGVCVSVTCRPQHPHRLQAIMLQVVMHVCAVTSHMMYQV